MARIPLPTRDTLHDEALERRWERQAARGQVLNIYRLFMVNPTIELNARRIWDASGLEPRARELVILRCAYTQQSRYEWHQHVRIARQIGLSPADINAIRDWSASDRFSPAERDLLAYVDELITTSRPGDDVFAAFSQGRTPADVLGVSMLVTTYCQLARLMSAFDLETEAPFVGWELAAESD